MEVMLLTKESEPVVDQERKSDSHGETTDKIGEASSKASAEPEIKNKPEDQLEVETTRAAMWEVREENERLKSFLAQIVKDYQSLQMHFFDIMKSDQTKKNPDQDHHANPDPSPVRDEPELVSLSLGSGSTGHKNQEQKINPAGDLALGLDRKEADLADVKSDVQFSLMSSENSSEETPAKEDTWPPSKALKNIGRAEEEVAPQAQVKRARVSVRARCDAPTMNDGCQWRKYGQKIAKGNPCPRAYYRCTVAPGCPVRKQVQRCAEDMSILITTYEGNHNHPLPISATAMASTTAAAASMLTSGSSSSSTNPMTAAANSAAGLQFTFPDGLRQSRQFYFTNPSISPSPSHPTITLDLTSPSSAAAVSQGSRRSFYSPPTSFSFSPAESSIWNSSGSYLSYGGQQPPWYKNYGVGGNARQAAETLFHNNSKAAAGLGQNPITHTIAKAITSDPTFQSALAAAITSYVGGNAGGSGGGGEQGSSAGGGGVVKWGEQLK